MIVLVLVATIAMTVADVFQGLYTILINQNRPALAGLFDGLFDVCNGVAIVGAGGTAFSVAGGHLRVNITWWSALAYGGVLVGSEIGALVADLLSRRLHGVPMRELLVHPNP